VGGSLPSLLGCKKYHCVRGETTKQNIKIYTSAQYHGRKIKQQEQNYITLQFFRMIATQVKMSSKRTWSRHFQPPVGTPQFSDETLPKVPKGGVQTLKNVTL